MICLEWKLLSQAAVLVIWSSSVVIAFDSPVVSFIEKHCVACHGVDSPAARLCLDELALDFEDPAKAAVWTRVYDKVVSGEMPPPSEEPPGFDDRSSFTRELRSELHTFSLRRQLTEGRVVFRRLNRIEYENTLRDLLDMPIHVRDLLPEDGVSAGFDTVSSALEISPTHLVRFQQAADAALTAAITTTPPNALHEKFTGKEWYEREVKGGRKWVPRGAAPEGDAVVLYHQTRQHWEMNVMPSREIRLPGLYRIRMTAAARNTGGKPLPIRFGWEWMPANTQLSHIISYRDVPADRPTTIELTFEVHPSATTRRVGVTAYTLPTLPGEDASAADWTNAPGLVVHDYEIEGPLGGWPSPGHRILFGDLPLEPQSFAAARAAGEPVPAANWMTWPAHVFEQNPLVPLSTDPKADAKRLIRSFLPRAFRRPVQAGETEYFVKFAHDRIARGVPFGEAVLAAYKAVLCSPHVLFLPAKPGPLSDHALASRLSYFLWSSTPDAELLAVADQGKLHQPVSLRVQVERMLNDPKSTRFVENFTGQWLDLRKVFVMKPDEHYHEYDDSLGWSLPQETTNVFTEMLKADRSVTEFIDSDWTFANQRLAKHYGIPNVVGMEFRRVALKPEFHRGGIMTHAAILKATANGSYTSPVKRGVWVLDRLIGTPPDPPPPDVAAIEPDIRGAITLRQQLEKHRALPNCAGCHAKIDPPGFALESYDVIGGWRQQYRSADHGRIRPLENYPELKPVHFTAPVETASVTAAGAPFNNLDDYKQLLLQDPEQIARTIARKLLIYGTGADIQFADREVIEQIVTASKKKNRGLRTVLHEVIQSRVFLNK